MVIDSPCLNDKKELAIPEKTTTRKESTNPLMADSLPKTIVPTKYFSFGRHLDELHVTWAHLEKKRTEDRTNQDFGRFVLHQSLRGRDKLYTTPSQLSSDGVTIFMTASARTDSKRRSEDSSFDMRNN
ncbi:hypothetical protein Tco_0762682 [Tanacetum coccineum]